MAPVMRLDKNLPHGYSGTMVCAQSRCHVLCTYSVHISLPSFYIHYNNSDVAGFSDLTSRLAPQEAVGVIDHLHALIDETFTHPDIFLMERTSSGCIAASGLVEAYPETQRSGAESQLSMTDSSYGSVTDLNDAKQQETTHSHSIMTAKPLLHQQQESDAQSSPSISLVF